MLQAMPMDKSYKHNLIHTLVHKDCVTPSESALCKLQRFPPNPHRNDSKVPTRNLRAGGKRSNNITQQSSMGPIEQIYTTATRRVKNTYIIYKDPNHLENDRASDYGQDANGAKSPEE